MATFGAYSLDDRTEKKRTCEEFKTRTNKVRIVIYTFDTVS